MPWIQQSDSVVNPGRYAFCGDVTLARQYFSVRFPTRPNQERAYYGILTHLYPIEYPTRSIDGELSSRAVWVNPSSWRIPEDAVVGVVRFYLAKHWPEPLRVVTYKFVP